MLLVPSTQSPHPRRGEKEKCGWKEIWGQCKLFKLKKNKKPNQRTTTKNVSPQELLLPPYRGPSRPVGERKTQNMKKCAQCCLLLVCSSCFMRVLSLRHLYTLFFKRSFSSFSLYKNNIHPPMKFPKYNLKGGIKSCQLDDCCRVLVSSSFIVCPAYGERTAPLSPVSLPGSQTPLQVKARSCGVPSAPGGGGLRKVTQP